jgi:hypothetical protein
MKLLLVIALAIAVQCIDITTPAGGQLPFDNANNKGVFNVNNGLNCNNLTCPNCNGSKYDVAFADAAGNEVIEVDFGYTQQSTNGPNCPAGTVFTVIRVAATGTAPTGYKFAVPGESWTATITGLPNGAAPCTYTNTDPNELNAVVGTMSCLKFEWIWTKAFPNYKIADAQANLRWGAKLNGVWTVNDNVNVGPQTYKADETKILVSSPAFNEYAVFVNANPITTTPATAPAPTPTKAAGAVVMFSYLVALLALFLVF